MTRAELLELLKKARKQLKKYHVPNDEQTVTLSINTIENALLEQPEIVRCKDCKHYNFKQKWCDYLSEMYDQGGEWFCAEGERRTDDA